MYKDFVDTIKEIAFDINPNGTFYHGRVSDANLAIEKQSLPQVHLYPFTISRADQNQAVDTIPNVLIALIFQDTPHTNDEERLEIIEQADIMQRRLEQWLIAKNVQYTGYQAEPYFKQFNGITSGMFVRFNAKVISTVVDCLPTPMPEPTPPPQDCTDITFGYRATCGTVAEPPENWESFTFDLSNARTGNVLQFVDLENENLYIDFGIQINTGAIGLRSFEDVGTVFTSFVTDATITCWASFDLSSLEIQTGTFSGGNADEMTITNFSGILAPSLINVDITCYEIEVASFDAIAGQLDNYGLTNGTLSVLTVVPMVGFDINIVNSLIGKGWTVNYSI
jgi:hypothetical protein